MDKVKAVVGTNAWGSALYEKALRGSAVDEETLRETIREAVKHDLVMFDTAQDYGFGKGQKIIGELCPAEIMISAKYTPMSGKYVRGQVRKSLEKDLTDFKREYVDVYWLHLPNAIEENLKEIAQLYREGKIKNIGISNFNLTECRKAKDVLDAENIPLYGVQNHYSLISREWETKGVASWCKENDIAFWAWAVLEEGILVPPKKEEKKSLMKLIFAGKRRKLAPLYRELQEIGGSHRITAAQVAMAYVANKGIIPICGCRKPYQIKQLYEAVQTVLDDSEMKRLETVAEQINVRVLSADMFRFAVKRKKETI